MTRELGPNGGGRRKWNESEDPSFSPQTTQSEEQLKAFGGQGWSAQHVQSLQHTQGSHGRQASTCVPLRQDSQPITGGVCVLRGSVMSDSL